MCVCVLASEQGSYLRTEQNSAFCLVISMGVQIIWQKYLKWYLNIEKDTGFKNSGTSGRDLKSPSPTSSHSPQSLFWSHGIALRPGRSELLQSGKACGEARQHGAMLLHTLQCVCLLQCRFRAESPPNPALFHSLRAGTLKVMDFTRLVMMTCFKTFRFPLFSM